MKSIHLPYQIDEKSRFGFYETNWKQCGLNLLNKHFPFPQVTSVLDFGCGRGEVAAMYSKSGYQVTGTDTDEECVRISNTHGDALLLDTVDPVNQFGEKSYDVVVCYHVLEHVPTPVETIKIISKIAKHAVIIAVPNLRNLNRLFRREIDYSAVNEGHLQSWDHAHLQSLAERHANLKLLEWGQDATQLPLFNKIGPMLVGEQFMIHLETKVFTKLFPFHGVSAIGIFKPTEY